MLFSLGLRRFPPVDVLLGIAAGRAPMNDKALNYLLAHTSSHYINFDPSGFSGVAFIPATRRDGQIFMAKPGEVSVLAPFTRIDSQAKLVGVHQLGLCYLGLCSRRRLGLVSGERCEAPYPHRSSDGAAHIGHVGQPHYRHRQGKEDLRGELKLNTSGTSNAEKATQYLAGRMGHTAPGALERLHNAPFIPVKTEKDLKVYRPNEVYFAGRGGENPLYRNAFTFVDFGERANAFLRYCGVRSEPSVKGKSGVVPRRQRNVCKLTSQTSLIY